MGSSLGEGGHEGTAAESRESASTVSGWTKGESVEESKKASGAAAREVSGLGG